MDTTPYLVTWITPTGGVEKEWCATSDQARSAAQRQTRRGARHVVYSGPDQLSTHVGGGPHGQMIETRLL